MPSAVVFIAFYFMNNALFHGAVSLPFSLLGIIILYPFYSGVVLVCRNIARGDSKVPVVKCFFTAIKDNFFHFLLHGVILYVIITLSALAVSFYISLLGAGWFFYVFLFFSVIIALMLLYTSFYIPLMSVTYDLPLRYIYKNSLLMSFGEFKNNFFATLALAVVFGICFTITAFVKSPTALAVILAALWTLLVPATATFMIVFFIYDGMTNIMRNKEDISKELTDTINKDLEDRAKKQAVQPVVEDNFSDIDIASLKDTDDYIFHNGKMVKQSTILRILREREKKEKDKQTKT